MNRQIARSLLICFMAISWVLIWRPVSAQELGRIILTTAAGGSVDMLARKLSITNELRSGWANQIVIDNRSGANDRGELGLLAVDAVRSFPTDGSAVLIAYVRESGQGVIPYNFLLNALNDFVPIMYLGSVNSASGRFWYGAYGAPGMSRTTAQKIENALQRAMRSSEMQALLSSSSFALHQQDRSLSPGSLATAAQASKAAIAEARAQIEKSYASAAGSSAAPNPNSTATPQTANGGIVMSAAPSKAGGWPVDMERGNLYFVLAELGSMYYPSPAVMVAAPSAAEAIQRIGSAYEKAIAPLRGRYNPASLPPGRFSVMAGGECPGPAWGAVVTNANYNSRESMWGGGCSSTPAAAIEAAFAACAKRSPAGCNQAPSNDWQGPQVYLALSGSNSWGGHYCPPMGSCDPSDQAQFGAFNAWTRHYSRNGPPYIKSKADAIANLGKECDDGNGPSKPCYTQSTTSRCYATTPIPQIGKMCTDPKLTQHGFSGSIKERR